MTRLEYRTEESQKYWEPQLEKNTLVVRFGKIGAEGQTHTKKFLSSAKAQNEYRKLICGKLAKGYKPDKFPELDPIENPTVIAQMMMTHHADPRTCTQICKWLTFCIQNKMLPSMMRSGFNRMLYNEEEIIWDWIDALEDDLPDFYEKAFRNGADRFAWFDPNTAYPDIIALKGDPGARAIEIGALRVENCRDDEGNWLNEWPNSLGPGAPIAGLELYMAELRDGKIIDI